MAKTRLRLITVAAVWLFAMAASASVGISRVTLARNGEARAAIITARNPTPAARLAAIELQRHIELITGATLPVKAVGEEPQGVRILVGESAATRELGLKASDFEPQEYLIRFLPDTIVLMGRDWIDRPENRAEAGRGTNWERTIQERRPTINYLEATERDPVRADGSKILADIDPTALELPGLFDDQATCYAVYDFLERFCGVRWYGPTPLNIIHPKRETLVVRGEERRRSPALKHREGLGGGWPIINAQWNKPSPDQLELYWRRLRLGGEKWAGNHSIRSFQDRFFKKNPDAPELWEGKRPEFFAQGRSGGAGSLQFCYTNPGLIKQMARDARDYFDGKGLKGYQLAMGDYFAVVPNDNAAWCTCERCQALLDKDKKNRRADHFNSGAATHYIFNFVNEVAKEVAKTHPDKYISTLAYHVYAFRPTEFELEPNVAVAPCLQVRNYWAPRIRENEMDFYKKWVEPRDRPIFAWNYYNFPTEVALGGGWHCFPGFSAHRLAENIKMYHADGVRGVFLCGIGEQVDYYLTMKMYDDPTIEPDGLLDEFFSGYFGAAAEPMKRFFNRIEEIYWNSENYPPEVLTEEKQFHQTEEIAWKYLGTEERMTELGAMMEKAAAMARTQLEKRRVATWKRGVWDYMVEGRRKYLAKRTNP